MVAAEIDAESDRARRTARRIESEWPIAPPGPVTRFVRAVGIRLGDQVDDAPYVWRFTLIRSRAPNAFSIGGGRIYVNEGLPFACDNEAELAAVLAHEMGHELAGHFRRREQGFGDSLIGSLFGHNGDGSGDLLIGSVRQHVDPRKEQEADRISLEILDRAGYDPHAALTAAERLDRAAGTNYLRSEDRIDALERELGSFPPGGRLDSAEFRRLKQTVPRSSE